jgi:hypothetical protein
MNWQGRNARFSVAFRAKKRLAVCMKSIILNHTQSAPDQSPDRSIFTRRMADLHPPHNRSLFPNDRSSPAEWSIFTRSIIDLYSRIIDLYSRMTDLHPQHNRSSPAEWLIFTRSIIDLHPPNGRSSPAA